MLRLLAILAPTFLLNAYASTTLNLVVNVSEYRSLTSSNGVDFQAIRSITRGKTEFTKYRDGKVLLKNDFAIDHDFTGEDRFMLTFSNDIECNLRVEKKHPVAGTAPVAITNKENIKEISISRDSVAKMYQESLMASAYGFMHSLDFEIDKYQISINVDSSDLKCSGNDKSLNCQQSFQLNIQAHSEENI